MSADGIRQPDLSTATICARGQEHVCWHCSGEDLGKLICSEYVDVLWDALAISITNRERCTWKQRSPCVQEQVSRKVQVLCTVSVSPTDVSDSEVSFRYLCVSASSVGFLTLTTRMVLTCCTCCWFSFSSAGHIPPTHWLLPLRHSLESPCVTKVPLSEFDASLVFADNYLVCFEGLYNVAPTTSCGTLPVCLPYLQPSPSDGISITFAGLV